MHPPKAAIHDRVLRAASFLCAVLCVGACGSEAASQSSSATGALPPDPILGPDADGDGVRDDIGDYIDDALRNEPLSRNAALQHARAVRAALATPATRSAAVAAATATFRAVECMIFVRGPHGDMTVLKEIEARTLDTDARIYAHLEREKLLGGMHYALTNGADERVACDFDTSSLRRAP